MDKAVRGTIVSCSFVFLSIITLRGRARNWLERVLVYPVIGALVGSWIGAIPIALDWDRPWQAWPLTPAYGGMAGYMVATLMAFIVATINLMAQVNISAQVVPETKPSKKKKKKKKTKSS